MDEALLKQDSAAADDKIDIFLIEADYALKICGFPNIRWMSRRMSGLTDDDLKDQYQYTKDIVTVDGVQKGTHGRQPGSVAYRRSIAKMCWAPMIRPRCQAALSDWDKFNDVAEKAAAKGYKMLSGYDDSYRTFSNNVSAGWVDGTTVKVDPQHYELGRSDQDLHR